MQVHKLKRLAELERNNDGDDMNSTALCPPETPKSRLMRLVAELPTAGVRSTKPLDWPQVAVCTPDDDGAGMARLDAALARLRRFNTEEKVTLK